MKFKLIVLLLLCVIVMPHVTFADQNDEIDTAISQMSNRSTMLKGYQFFIRNDELENSEVVYKMIDAIKNVKGFEDNSTRRYAYLILRDYNAVAFDEGFTLFKEGLSDSWDEIKRISIKALINSPENKITETTDILYRFMIEQLQDFNSDPGLYEYAILAFSKLGAKASSKKNQILEIAVRSDLDTDTQLQANRAYLDIVGLEEYLNTIESGMLLNDEHNIKSLYSYGIINRQNKSIAISTLNRASQYILGHVDNNQNNIRINAIKYSTIIKVWDQYNQTSETAKNVDSLINILKTVMQSESNEEVKEIASDRLSILNQELEK